MEETSTSHSYAPMLFFSHLSSLSTHLGIFWDRRIKSGALASTQKSIMKSREWSLASGYFKIQHTFCMLRIIYCSTELGSLRGDLFLQTRWEKVEWPSGSVRVTDPISDSCS